MQFLAQNSHSNHLVSNDEVLDLWMFLSILNIVEFVIAVSIFECLAHYRQLLLSCLLCFFLRQQLGVHEQETPKRQTTRIKC